MLPNKKRGSGSGPVTKYVEAIRAMTVTLVLKWLLGRTTMYLAIGFLQTRATWPSRQAFGRVDLAESGNAPPRTMEDSVAWHCELRADCFGCGWRRRLPLGSSWRRWQEAPLQGR